MSILSSLLQQFLGSDDEESVVERPCSNCPSHCAIASLGACAECEPYKKKLIDQVYNIDHLEEFYDRYEVTGVTATSVSGTVTCPVCGAHSANHYICEYCDSKIADSPASSGKIQVERASDIPNPIMDAQDIIFERYDTVIKKYTSSKGSRSILGDLFDALTGSDEEEDSSLGAKMSEAEIKEAAELYKLSVGEYLTGLDNGTCLTLKGKKAADQQALHSTAASEPASFGLPGIAGIGLLSSALIHQTEIQPHHYKPQTFTFGISQPHVKPQSHGTQSFFGMPQQQVKPQQQIKPQQGNSSLFGSQQPQNKPQSQAKPQSLMETLLFGKPQSQNKPQAQSKPQSHGKPQSQNKPQSQAKPQNLGGGQFGQQQFKPGDAMPLHPGLKEKPHSKDNRRRDK